MSEEPKSTNSFQLLLIGLLIIGAFLVGTLWTKVKSLENKVAGNPAPVAGQGQVAGEAAQPAEKSILEDLPAIASAVGLDQKAFSECVDSKKFAQKVTDDAKSGADAGINGTPGVILLDTKSGKTLVLPGAVPIEQIKQGIDSLLNNTAADAKVKVKPLSTEDHVRGNRSAQILLIEYSDIQCPFCKRFHPTPKQVVEDYNGQVAWIYRHFPLDGLHPFARPAAEATECAASMGGEDAFWKMLDKMSE